MTGATTDAITLTMPRERDYHGVAHLVLGGLAARLNLTIETLEDLQLAVDSLLEHRRDDEPVTVEVQLLKASIETGIGPFSSDEIRADLADEGPELGLRRVLETVADEVALEDRDGALWVRLTKSLEPAGTA